MKGMVKGLTAIALATALFAAPAHAQGSVGIGGSGLFSLEEGGGSDFGASAMFGWAGANGFGFRADASYIFSDPASVLVNADVMYRFMTSETSTIHPYILAGGTLLGLDTFDEMLYGINAGAGFDFMMSNSNITPFAEARFVYTFEKDLFASASWLQAIAGVKFPLGQ